MPYEREAPHSAVPGELAAELKGSAEPLRGQQASKASEKTRVGLRASRSYFAPRTRLERRPGSVVAARKHGLPVSSARANSDNTGELTSGPTVNRGLNRTERDGFIFGSRSSTTRLTDKIESKVLAVMEMRSAQNSSRV